MYTSDYDWSLEMYTSLQLSTIQMYNMFDGHTDWYDGSFEVSEDTSVIILPSSIVYESQIILLPF